MKPPAPVTSTLTCSAIMLFFSSVNKVILLKGNLSWRAREKQTSFNGPTETQSPSTSRSAAVTSFQRASGNAAIQGPSKLRSTVFIHSGFNTQSPGSPSSLDNRTSQGRSLICVDKGITGICVNDGRISWRPSTGLRLSGASKRNQRMSPRVITGSQYQSRPQSARLDPSRPMLARTRDVAELRVAVHPSVRGGHEPACRPFPAPCALAQSWCLAKFLSERS